MTHDMLHTNVLLIAPEVHRSDSVQYLGQLVNRTVRPQETLIRQDNLKTFFKDH